MIQPDMNKIRKMTNISTPGKKMFRDSDGDGVKDVLDCKPHDKSEQGVVHKVGRFAAIKLLAKGHKERAVKFISRKERESEELKKIKIEERQKQARETAKFREQERGRRQREFIKRGGHRGALKRTFVDIGRTIDRGTRPKPQYTYVTTKGKKGKKRKVRVQVKQQPRQPPKMPDISSVRIPGL